MIYLDNAATSFPKPKSVVAAANNALINFSANPGRGGHNLSLRASKEIYNCRKSIAKLFNVNNVENIVFTSNCTHALNIVIKGILKKGDHVVISSLEHNSVVRPLETLKKSINISYDIAKVSFESDDETLDNFRKAFNTKTKLVVCTHASNVWGRILPVERLSAMCKQYGIFVCVDAAQSAGIIDIDYTDSMIDFICMAGHKGLYGPMGTGILITNKGEILSSLIDGGTGSKSIQFEQPNFMPDRFESGTLNLPGICSLKAGVEFVQKIGQHKIYLEEMKLIQKLHDRLMNLSHVKLYTERPYLGGYVPLLSFNLKNKKSEDVSEYLNNHSIAIRAGLHCSPLAHNHMGTLDYGAVRVAPSIFTSNKEIDIILNKIIKFTI